MNFIGQPRRARVATHAWSLLAKATATKQHPYTWYTIINHVFFDQGVRHHNTFDTNVVPVGQSDGYKRTSHIYRAHDYQLFRQVAQHRNSCWIKYQFFDASNYRTSICRIVSNVNCPPSPDIPVFVMLTLNKSYDYRNIEIVSISFFVYRYRMYRVRF